MITQHKIMIPNDMLMELFSQLVSHSMYFKFVSSITYLTEIPDATVHWPIEGHTPTHTTS